MSCGRRIEVFAVFVNKVINCLKCPKMFDTVSILRRDHLISHYRNEEAYHKDLECGSEMGGGGFNTYEKQHQFMPRCRPFSTPKDG
jgi:hypothetical protein